MKLQKITRTILLMSGLVLANCAAGPVQARADDPVRTAKITHACKDIMGFAPGETLYADCMAVLRRSMAGVDEAQRVDAARQSCLARRLAPGTSEFAHCVLGDSTQASR